MSEPSLDDRIKQAQIEKTRAETLKIQNEANAVGKQLNSAFWSDAVKILGGVVLGLGGVILAYTQYEVGELKAKIAKDDLMRAQSAATEAQKSRLVAESAASAALAKRDVAIREQKEAEAASAELKLTLTQTDSALKAAKPEQTRTRLAYVQFRGGLTRELITELRTALAGKAFNAPGAERVEGEYQNLVKYFKATEQKDAEELAAAVESFFATRQCPLKMRVVPASSTAIQNPPLEIWLFHKCAK